MKKRTWLPFLALLLALSFVVSGCTATPDKVIEKALAANQKMKNCDVTMDMSLSMEQDGQGIDMSVLATGTIFNEPKKVKLDMSVDMKAPGMEGAEMLSMLFPMKMNYYVVNENGKDMMYMHLMETWMKSDITGQMEDATKQVPTDIVSNDVSYLKGIEKIELIGTEEIEGEKLMHVRGTISGDALKQAMKGKLSTFENLSSTGINIDETQIKEVAVDVWAEPSSYQIRRIDMNLTDTIIAMMAPKEGEPNITKCTMSMTMKNIDKAADFTLPEAAKNAEEADLTASPT